MKKTIINKGDMNPIFEGISRLKSKVVTKANQKTNKIVSIEAMKRFLGMKLPEVFKNHDFEIIKEKEQKSVFINGVEIIVSPDVIYKITIDNQDYLGAVKFHISKTNVFDIEKSTRVAFIIEKYLEEISPKYEAKVISDLCFSIDVFGQRVISAPKLKNRVFNDVKLVCDEIKKIWSAA